MMNTKSQHSQVQSMADQQWMNADEHIDMFTRLANNECESMDDKEHLIAALACTMVAAELRMRRASRSLSQTD